MTPTILIDVDGPLTFGFARAACAVLRDLGIEDAETWRISQWDIARAFNVPPLIEAEMYGRLRRAGVASSFDPRAGAREFLDELRGWARVVAATAPLGGSKTWVGERMEWLHDMLGFQARDVVNADDKTLIAGDALVEDRPKNLLAWRDVRNRLSVLWDATYNQECTDGRVVRVRDFAQLREVLEMEFGRR